MRAVVQRVGFGSVAVDARLVAEIGRGLVILLGIGPDDNEEKADALVKKIASLRIFADENGKMNLSVRDISGSVIVVSQFTLYADLRKGNRPSFTGAAIPEKARPIVEYFIRAFSECGVPAQSGEFGAHMQVKIENDGPVTIWLET